MSPNVENKDDDDGENGGPEFDLDPDMLARAEQAIAGHGDAFRVTVRARIDDMTRLTDTLAGAPGTGGDPVAWKAMFEHGHDLAGQGGTFGYPLISDIGQSLCAFIDSRGGATSSGDIEILRAHVAAIAQAVSQETTGGDANPALLSELQNLVRRRLA